MSRTRFVGPSEDEPIEPWFAPLRGVARAVVGDPRYRFFDPDDFMVMVRLVRRPRPDIILYKHIFTRRYLNLDDAGHAYLYIPPRSELSNYLGRYVPHRDLRAALNDLSLWELPWLKPGLEHERCGLDWDERWQLRRALLA